MNLSVFKSISPKVVKNLATQRLGRAGVVAQKYSPEILTAVGVVGTVTSAVMASRATLKLEPIIDSTKSGVEDIRSRRNDTDHSESDYAKDLAYIYTINAKDLVKLYGPSITLGIASIGCLVGAQGVLKKRNIALAAAYKTVEHSFSEYRKRVISEFGEEKDREYRVPVTKTSLTSKETGKVKTVEHINPNNISGYARFFDELSQHWTKTPEYNLLFLRCQQNWANDMLQARGHLFLNEVYDALGLPRSKAGSVVGWVLGKNGDNFVDFGIYDFENEKAREFVNGVERSILLDFNVDGVIYDLIEND